MLPFERPETDHIFTDVGQTVAIMAGFSFRLLAVPRSAWGSPLPSWPAVALMAPRGSPSPSWPDTLRRRVPGVTVAIMAGRHHHGTQGVSVALMAGSPFPDKLRFFVESRGITVAIMAG